MSLTREDLDRLCSPSYLDGLADAAVTDLRVRRDACQRAEVVLSYLRRVIQGEIDLVLAEIDMRTSAGGSNVSRLVEDLPSILAPSGATTEPAHTSLPTMEAVAEVLDLNDEMGLEELLTQVIVGNDESGNALPGGLLPGANLCNFADEELRTTLDRLREEETLLSGRRRALHEQIDEIQAAIVDRYKSGSADPDALLR